MHTIDRMLFLGYLRNYAIVFISMMTLYVAVDLFMNLNDFAKNENGLFAAAVHIAGYYGVQSTQIFNILSEAITLMAAAFTVAWMQRSNELLPQLSAGVSTQRVIRPILLGAFLTAALGPLNTELLIPRLADRLTVQRDDPDRLKAQPVRGNYDPATKEHFVGASAFRKESKVTQFEYTSGAEGDRGLVHLFAEEAVYVPPTGAPLTGGWHLYNARPATLDEDRRPKNIQALTPGQYFLKAGDVDFDSVTRRGTWFVYAPTARLWDLLGKPDAGRQPTIAVLFHQRLTKPITGLLMIVLGLALILRDQNRHVFISAGYCLVALAMYYVLTLAAKYFGDHDVLPPALAAWIPVMLFGPVALAQYDAIHT